MSVTSSIRVSGDAPPMRSARTGAATQDMRPIGIAAAAQTAKIWRREYWGMTTAGRSAGIAAARPRVDRVSEMVMVVKLLPGGL